MQEVFVAKHFLGSTPQNYWDNITVSWKERSWRLEVDGCVARQSLCPALTSNAFLLKGHYTEYLDAGCRWITLILNDISRNVDIRVRGFPTFSPGDRVVFRDPETTNAAVKAN